jgi:hypothetical protein
MLDIMIMDTLFVNNVIQNVPPVTNTLVVIPVLKVESTLQNVYAQKDNTLILTGSVNLVTTCVPPVTLIHIPVSFVLVTESMLQIVTVLKDTSMMVLVQIVKFVLIDVLLVPLVTNVPLVLLEEWTLQFVNVHPVMLNYVQPVTTYVMLPAQLQPVSLVPLNVSNVKILHPNVKFVLETESMLQNVTVQKDTITMVPPTVHFVPLNVLLVKIVLITVSLVPKEESTHQNVIVPLVNTSMVLNVLIVPYNVIPVLLMKLVLLVPITPELKPQFVNVTSVTMKMEPQNVHLVKKNVKFVTFPQVTVSLVLEKESTHQLVNYQNKSLNQLLLMMFQLVLLKSSNVTAIVILVKSLLLTVWLVAHTELTLQLVDVLLVTMKIIANVQPVLMFVSLVMLPNVSNVKIHNTDLFHYVNVLMDTSIKVLNTALLVKYNVLLVKLLLTIVSLVPLVENNLHHNVHAHLVKLPLMDTANHVTTDVKNVVKLPWIVNLGLISESMLHLVSVQMDSMMMVTMLNVSHVWIFVKPVLTLPVVSLVKNTEPKTHHPVHVKTTTWNVTMMDLAVNVITDVKNVLNTPITSTEDSVLPVLMEELTTHHLVTVHMEPSKLNNNVSHVMKIDVKPVLKTKIIVKLVELTEFKLHQSVHVIPDIGKTKTNNVNHVSPDVILVKPLKITVWSVLVSELMLQCVTAQMVTSRTKPELVPLVLQNV